MSEEKVTETENTPAVEVETPAVIAEAPKQDTPAKKAKAKTTATTRTSAPKKVVTKTANKALKEKAAKKKPVEKESNTLVPATTAPTMNTTAGIEDALAFGQDNFDALIAANTSFFQGLQDLNKEVMGMVQASFEGNAGVTKKIMACESVDDVVALQGELVKEGVSSAIQQSQTLSNLSVKVIEDSAAPLAERVNVAVEKLSKPLAA